MKLSSTLFSRNSGSTWENMCMNLAVTQGKSNKCIQATWLKFKGCLVKKKISFLRGGRSQKTLPGGVASAFSLKETWVLYICI